MKRYLFNYRYSYARHLVLPVLAQSFLSEDDINGRRDNRTVHEIVSMRDKAQQRERERNSKYKENK